MKRLFFLLILAFCAYLTSCASGHYEVQKWMEKNGKVKVLATTAMIADMTKEIAGDEADIIVLIKGDLDPHSYQLVKGDDEKLVHADLILANGLGLEHGPSLQRHLEANPKAHFLGSILQETYPEDILKVGNQTDPHIWMDLSLIAKTTPVIVEALSQHLPEKKALFLEREKTLQSKLVKAHEEAKAVLHQVPKEKRFLITSHDAFNYFSRAYLSEPEEIADGSWKKRFKAPEGLSPESQLSTKDIFDIIEHAEKYHIEVIFPESNVSADSLKKIRDAGQEKGLKISLGNPFLYGDAMGPPGSDGDTLTKMVVHNAKTIAEDLQGGGDE